MSERRGTPRDKEAEKQSSDANKSKDRRAAGRDGHYLKSISVPLRPADTGPTALVIHRTNTVMSHKQESSNNLDFRREICSFQSTNKMSGYQSIAADCCLSSRSEENPAWIKKSQQRNRLFLWHEAMTVENECVYAGMYVEPPGKDGWWMWVYQFRVRLTKIDKIKTPAGVQVVVMVAKWR